MEGREHLQPYRVMLPGESGGALQVGRCGSEAVASLASPARRCTSVPTTHHWTRFCPAPHCFPCCPQPRTNTRFFCKECGCHLWAQDPSWPQVGPGPAHLPTGTGSLLGTALLPLGRLCHACPASPSLSGTLRRPSCPTFWWVYPFAGAIDTELPALPRSVHMMLAYKADWVKPQVGAGGRAGENQRRGASMGRYYWSLLLMLGGGASPLQHHHTLQHLPLPGPPGGADLPKIVGIVSPALTGISLLPALLGAGGPAG